MRRQTFRAHAAWLATVTLAACASAKRNAPPEQVNVTPTTIRVETPSGTVEARTTAEDRATAITINVAPEVAWKNLPAVYGELQARARASGRRSAMSRERERRAEPHAHAARPRIRRFGDLPELGAEREADARRQCEVRNRCRAHDPVARVERAAAARTSIERERRRERKRECARRTEPQAPAHSGAERDLVGADHLPGVLRRCSR